MSWLILLALLKKLDKKIDDLETVTFRKVDELPATGEANVIYFVPKTDAEEGNYSDEYIWDSTSETYEQIGDSAIDPLPEVTAADNGKVLGVANGEWGKVENDTMKITIFAISNSGSSDNLDNNKTINDLINAINNGDLVYLANNNKYYYLSSVQGNDYTFSSCDIIDNGYSIRFTKIVFDKRYPSRNWGQHIEIDMPKIPNISQSRGKILSNNGSITMWVDKELPSVTSSDEGKVLTVNSNGEWVASALPDGTNQQY